MLWLAIVCSVAGLLCCYVTVSCLLLHRPTLLHKRKRRHFACAHISHRGGAAELAENTMEAFRTAIVEYGTQMLELDCQITRDGQIVIAHDNSLKRVCGFEANISELDYSELPPMLPELPVTFDPSAKVTDGSDRRIPLLSEVFDEFPPTVAVNIDVKEDDERLAAGVAELVRRYGRQRTVVWGSGRHKIVERMRRLDPTVATMFSLRRTMSTVLLYITGLLPFVPITETHYEPPMPSMALGPAAAPMWAQVSQPLRCLARSLVRLLDVLLLRPGLVEHLAKRGIPTYAWVLNEEADFKRAFKVGCEGVMTDRPSRLRRFIDENQWCLRRYEEAAEAAKAEAERDGLLETGSG